VNYRIEKWAPGATRGIMVAGGSLGADSSQLNNPRGIYVDGDGAIYIADYFNNRIQKWLRGMNHGFTIAGNLIPGRTKYQFVNPSGVYVGPDNNLYVADEGNNRIEKFTTTSYINNFFIPFQPGTYRVIASFADGCIDTSAEVIVAGSQELNTTTNSNVSFNNLKVFAVYPNPTKQTVTAEFTTDKQEKYTIEITDMAGKKLLISQGVSNSGENVIKFAVDNLTSGIYIINLINNNRQTQSIKLLKE